MSSSTILTVFIVQLIVYSIIGMYALTTRNVGEMLLSTLLFAFLMGYIRLKVLNYELSKDEQIEMIMLPTLVYLNWYFLTHLSVNQTNTHSSLYDENDKFVMT